jgi:Planctomycete cytochrome C
LQERRERRRCFLVGTLALVLVALPSATAGSAGASTFGWTVVWPEEGPASFARDVGPLLDRWCVSCHGATEQEGNLRLDSYLWLMRGGDSGPVFIQGDPAQSLLIAKIERRDRPAMPPRRRLPASVVGRLRDWIAAGAAP